MDTCFFFPLPCSSIERQRPPDEPVYLKWTESGTTSTNDVDTKTLRIADTTYDVTWQELSDLPDKSCLVPISKLKETLDFFLPRALKGKMPLPPYNCFQQGDLVPQTAVVHVGAKRILVGFRRYKREFWVDTYTCIEKDGSKVTRCYDHKTGNRVDTDPNPSAFKGRTVANWFIRN